MAQKVTIDDVEAAMLELQARQESISVASVREFLGRGSNTTITKFLRELRERSQGEDLPDLVDESSIAPAIVERLTKVSRRAALDAYIAISDPINEQLEAARSAILLERRQQQLENAQVIADADEIRTRAEALEAALESLRVENKELSASVRTLQEREVQLTAQRDGERRLYQQGMEQLQRHLTRAEEQIRVERIQLTQALEKHELAMTEAAELRGRLSALDKKV